MHTQPTQLQQKWSAQIKDWQQSQLNQTAYCKKHEINLDQFSYWKRKLINKKEKSQPSNYFVPLKTSAVITASQPLSIVLPNNVRIEGISIDNIALVKQLAGELQ
jgi:transposase-like protein